MKTIPAEKSFVKMDNSGMKKNVLNVTFLVKYVNKMLSDVQAAHQNSHWIKKTMYVKKFFVMTVSSGTTKNVKKLLALMVNTGMENKRNVTNVILHARLVMIIKYVQLALINGN